MIITAPTTRLVLHLLYAMPTVTNLDAFRALDISGASFTKRISELRQAGFPIQRVTRQDPISGRRYGVYSLAQKAA